MDATTTPDVGRGLSDLWDRIWGSNVDAANTALVQAEAAALTAQSVVIDPVKAFFDKVNTWAKDWTWLLIIVLVLLAYLAFKVL